MDGRLTANPAPPRIPLTTPLTPLFILQPPQEKDQEERAKVEDLRGSPLAVGNLEEMIDDNHAIVSSSVGPEYYVGVLSFVNQDLLEPGCTVLLHNKVMAVVGILSDDTDPMVSVMKVEKAPLESYADIGGLESQIQVRITSVFYAGC